MSEALKFGAEQVATYNGEEMREKAIRDGIAEMEQRLGCPIGEATALDRFSVATEVLNYLANEQDNRNRFKIEVIAGILKLAELELDFQMAKQKLNALYQ